MQRLLLALTLTLCACGSSPSMPAPDASGPAPGTFGAACTTVADMSSECMNQPCTGSIDMAGHPVCSQKCTMLKAQDPSCPNGSMGQFCNMQGFCKP